ncbi:MAG: monofunctional biosynthetic peptidoglycan transglycosylase [Thermomonas sp.]|uniref:monofunctional biosynthetic peptidoglycan transglycosylase n=1 Tax=Thermomonas sp. TaxID=1971895 RepID=UPI001EB64494|nr:monofunctional biosynthetic peptidoglycan transglycosylase [Thermomonas sp.]MBV2208341.1 monofunctional biosynthetic peptidoglycan transglycosylase [Thermomonas sp.]
MASAKRSGRSRVRGWWWKLPLLFVVVSVGQVVALRFIDPPVSTFMVARWLDAAVAGNFGFRLHYDFRSLRAVSPQLPLAVIASEDQNFIRHHGFDFAAIEKAQKHNEKMVARAEKRGTPVRRLRGASTISQQTAKNLFLWQGFGSTRWLRKGLEVWYTGLIEVLWPKRRILEMYVNVAEFGDGVYGAQAAARRYFGKDAARLNASEAARLAAVLPSPKRYNAAKPGPYVQKRARVIQRQMGKMGGAGYLQALN